MWKYKLEALKCFFNLLSTMIFHRVTMVWSCLIFKRGRTVRYKSVKINKVFKKDKIFFICNYFSPSDLKIVQLILYANIDLFILFFFSKYLAVFWMFDASVSLHDCLFLHTVLSFPDLLLLLSYNWNARIAMQSTA